MVFVLVSTAIALLLADVLLSLWLRRRESKRLEALNERYDEFFRSWSFQSTRIEATLGRLEAQLSTQKPTESPPETPEEAQQPFYGLYHPLRRSTDRPNKPTGGSPWVGEIQEVLNPTPIEQQQALFKSWEDVKAARRAREEHA